MTLLNLAVAELSSLARRFGQAGLMWAAERDCGSLSVTLKTIKGKESKEGKMYSQIRLLG
jgi:hypothetical protein